MAHISISRLVAPFSALAVAAVTSSFSKPAAACSCAYDLGFVANVPEDGAEGVPTNVVLLAAVGFGDTVVLVDEEDNEIAVTKEGDLNFGGFCSSGWELTPAAELLPNHTYRMLAGSGAEDSGTTTHPTTITFTTGDGPAVAASVPAPEAKLAVFDATNYQNSCVYSAIQGCLVTDSSDILEVHVAQDGETQRHLGTRDMVEHLEFGDATGEVCISVHTRDLAGHLSDPLERCFDANSAYEIAEAQDANLYPDCDHPAIQALLNGETPPEPDAGPTSNPSTADAGPTSTAPSADAGTTAGDSTEVDDTADGTAPPPAVDSGRPSENDAGAESDDEEDPISTPESDDSGCSVGPSPGQRSSAAWAAVFAACTVLLRRRKVNGR